MNTQQIFNGATPIDRATRHYSHAVALWSAGREQEAADALDATLREKDDFAEALSMGTYILSRSRQNRNGVTLLSPRRGLQARSRVRMVEHGQAAVSTGAL